MAAVRLEALNLYDWQNEYQEGYREIELKIRQTQLTLSGAKPLLARLSTAIVSVESQQQPHVSSSLIKLAADAVLSLSGELSEISFNQTQILNLSEMLTRKHNAIDAYARASANPRAAFNRTRVTGMNSSNKRVALQPPLKLILAIKSQVERALNQVTHSLNQNSRLENQMISLIKSLRRNTSKASDLSSGPSVETVLGTFKNKLHIVERRLKSQVVACNLLLTEPEDEREETDEQLLACLDEKISKLEALIEAIDHLQTEIDSRVVRAQNNLEAREAFMDIRGRGDGLVSTIGQQIMKLRTVKENLALASAQLEAFVEPAPVAAADSPLLQTGNISRALQFG